MCCAYSVKCVERDVLCINCKVVTEGCVYLWLFWSDHQDSNMTLACLQEEKHGQKAVESCKVEMYAQIPPIEKMDQALGSLITCEWA